MKCYYYLSPDLACTERIAEDLHDSGVSDWFIHTICKDEAGLKRTKLHSSNYLETLDIVRQGLLGAVLGFVTGIGVAALMLATQPFGAGIPGVAYGAVVFLLTCFGAWQGGLLGISIENKKIQAFHDHIDTGKCLVLVYAPKNKQESVERTMKKLHPEAELVGIDAQFFNPFSVPVLPATQSYRPTAR
jgi:hypothetical protein